MNEARAKEFRILVDYRELLRRLEMFHFDISGEDILPYH